jgi:hypothetical protein
MLVALNWRAGQWWSQWQIRQKGCFQSGFRYWVLRGEVRWWEARPPRKVVGISDFHWCRDESFILKQRWSREIDDSRCAAWGWYSRGGGIQVVARAFSGLRLSMWLSVRDDDTVRRLPAPLPSGGGVELCLIYVRLFVVLCRFSLLCHHVSSY